MTDSGDTVNSIEDENTSKKVTFTGDVNHTVFEQTLKKITVKRGTPWEFAWSEALAESQTTPYTVNITMSLETLEALFNGMVSRL